MGDLEKFLIMHEKDYQKALNEIKQGKKEHIGFGIFCL